mmetsp:Transcript_5244/g.14123  ORF Transcript_5244/g.14123 Transcript_5244/m.14123 type:complete len:339 (-) Transcript_5244:427-1443(-)
MPRPPEPHPGSASAAHSACSPAPKRWTAAAPQPVAAPLPAAAPATPVKWPVALCCFSAHHPLYLCRSSLLHWQVLASAAPQPFCCHLPQTPHQLSCPPQHRLPLQLQPAALRTLCLPVYLLPLASAGHWERTHLPRCLSTVACYKADALQTGWGGPREKESRGAQLLNTQGPVGLARRPAPLCACSLQSAACIGHSAAQAASLVSFPGCRFSSSAMTAEKWQVGWARTGNTCQVVLCLLAPGACPQVRHGSSALLLKSFYAFYPNVAAAAAAAAGGHYRPAPTPCLLHARCCTPACLASCNAPLALPCCCSCCRGGQGYSPFGCRAHLGVQTSRSMWH